MIGYRDDDFDEGSVNTKQLLVASLAIGAILSLWVFIASVHIG